MKSTKYTVIITTEVLSKDAIRSQIMKALEMIYQESPAGVISSDDGDDVSWSTIETPVEF